MIVRISGEDQYRLADGDGEVAELDDAAVKAVEAGTATGYELPTERCWTTCEATDSEWAKTSSSPPT